MARTDDPRYQAWKEMLRNRRLEQAGMKGGAKAPTAAEKDYPAVTPASEQGWYKNMVKDKAPKTVPASAAAATPAAAVDRPSPGAMRYTDVDVSPESVDPFPAGFKPTFTNPATAKGFDWGPPMKALRTILGLDSAAAFPEDAVGAQIREARGTPLGKELPGKASTDLATAWPGGPTPAKGERLPGTPSTDLAMAWPGYDPNAKPTPPPAEPPPEAAVGGPGAPAAPIGTEPGGEFAVGRDDVVELIRGTTMTYWNPKTRQEYPTPEHAMAGKPVGVTPREKEKWKHITNYGIAKVRADATVKAAQLRQDAGGSKSRYQVIKTDTGYEDSLPWQGLYIVDKQSGKVKSPMDASQEDITLALRDAAEEGNFLAMYQYLEAYKTARGAKLAKQYIKNLTKTNPELAAALNKWIVENAPSGGPHIEQPK